MKRLSSSDSSAAALITICQSTEEQSPRNKHMYGRELQSMLDGLDEEGCVVEEGHHSEKKRRLSVDQVKALEKSFEVENKLEPERKVKLAQELGLQPRQVAVWFQNRRARWKTKQLERDYGVLKANYEALKLNYDTLNQDNQALQKEIKELKSRLKEEKKSGSGSVWVKEEITVRRCSESEERNMDPAAASKSNKDECVEEGASASAFPAELKDKEGSSDSDSSAILNELDNSSPKGGIQFSPPHSSVNCFQFHKPYHYVKMEEHNFLSAEEACNFFSDDQPPSLHWYSPDEWN